MTPGEVLVPGALAIVFVVAWFVLGLIDGSRGDSHPKHAPSEAPSRGAEPLPERARHTAHTPRR